MFELLPSASPLKHRAPVHLHIGTAEVEAEARLLDSLEAMKPGRSGAVRFLLREPLPVLPGDRFIVRMFSPVVTIGGGVVADIVAPARIRRSDLAARTRKLVGASLDERVGLLVEESANGLSCSELVAWTGSRIGPVQNDWMVSETWRARKSEAIRSVLGAFHRENPLLPGMPKESLRAAVLGDAPSFLLDDLLTDDGVVVEGDAVRLASHRVSFREDEQADLDRLEGAFARAGLAVLSADEARVEAKLDAVRARTLLQILIRERRLLRVNNELMIHARAEVSLRSMLAMRKGQRFGVPEFKEWVGVSRKYAIPLLEWLDRIRVTRREGDYRVVL
jgi:selenocysteine-specific elongation factor